MGTQQELTTEQVEVLILIEDINKYLAENKETLEVPMSETVDGIIVTEDGCVEVCETLEYYDYIESTEDGYEVTVDGRQYIRLFKEYLKAKKENTAVIHKSFSLINIERFKMDMEACLGKANVTVDLGRIFELAKGAAEAVKKWAGKN